MEEFKVEREFELQIARYEAHKPKLRWALVESIDAVRRDSAEEIVGLGEALIGSRHEKPSAILVSFLKVYLDSWENRYGPADCGRKIHREVGMEK